MSMRIVQVSISPSSRHVGMLGRIVTDCCQLGALHVLPVPGQPAPASSVAHDADPAGAVRSSHVLRHLRIRGSYQRKLNVYSLAVVVRLWRKVFGYLRVGSGASGSP